MVVYDPNEEGRGSLVKRPAVYILGYGQEPGVRYAGLRLHDTGNVDREPGNPVSHGRLEDVRAVVEVDLAVVVDATVRVRIGERALGLAKASRTDYRGGGGVVKGERPRLGGA